MPRKVILDTDIGDDIDDAYALALILGSSELELVGVTTVFKNTPARARQAQTLLKLAGRPDVPVAAGCGAVLSPRVRNREPDLAWGQVSLGLVARELLEDIRPGQDRTALPADELPPLSTLHGVDFIVDTIMRGRGDVIPVTIGPMTNLAMALVKEPRIRSRIPRIVSMAACFDRLGSEWNILCDPVAAAIVFNSGIPMTVVGLDVTTKCLLDDSQLARLNGSQRPVARNLAAATRAWGGARPILHDPLAVETLVAPDIVGTQNGTVTVELAGGETYGYTTFSRAEGGAKGPHDIATTVKSGEATELWLQRVLAL